jgi:hypothetical protein
VIVVGTGAAICSLNAGCREAVSGFVDNVISAASSVFNEKPKDSAVQPAQALNVDVSSNVGSPNGGSGGDDDDDDDFSVDVSKLEVRADISLSGGRSGQLVKTLRGPPNSAVRGGAGRVFATDRNGRVVLDITKGRVKPVTPGRRFGDKRLPTQEELDLIKRVLGE